MKDLNFSDKITSLFLNYLDERGVSFNTLKFYKSDLSHFTGWFLLKIRSLGSSCENLTEAVPFLTNPIASEYRSYLLDNKVAIKTANRRLSTLRNFSRFLISSEIADGDFMRDLTNIDSSSRSSSILDEFSRFLKNEKVTDNTIKSYLSDIRQFLSWLETNHNSSATNP